MLQQKESPRRICGFDFLHNFDDPVVKNLMFSHIYAQKYN